MGVARIHFTQEAMAKVTVGQEPEWLMETFLSLLVARSGEVLAPHVSWQAWSQARHPSSIGALHTLVAPDNVPDFLTPLRTGGGLEGGIDAILSSPRGQLRRGLSALATHRRLPGWTRLLAEGEGQVLRAVGDAVRDYFQASVSPLEQHLSEQFEIQRSRFHQLLGAGGLDLVLNSLHPDIHWFSPVLKVVNCPIDSEVRIDLDQGGLHIQPVFFCPPHPWMNSGPPLTLFVPLGHTSHWQPPASAAPTPMPRRNRALDTLLGSGRAAVLRHVVAAGSCTTTGLAQRTGISPSTVSHHTTILRNAGLLTTHRTGTSVHHTATPTGTRLTQQP